jgi:hypothetical protein
MIRSLLISLFLLQAYFSFSQRPSFGHFVGRFGSETEGFEDMDFELQVFHAASGSDFKRGILVLNDSTVLKGFIHKKNSSLFIYKGNRDDDTETKYKLKDVAAYKVGDSTFYRSNFNTINKEYRMSVEVTQITNTGWINLYKINYFSSDNFVVKRSDGEFVTLTNKKGEFTNEASSYFSDVPFLIEKIASGEYKPDDIPVMAKIYQAYWDHKTGRKTKYSANWNVTPFEEDAVNYSLVESVDNQQISIGYYDELGRKVLTADYQKYAEERDGKHTWYYANGNVRKVAFLLNNEIDSLVTEYYANGKPLWTYKGSSTERVYESAWNADGQQVVIDGNGSLEINDSLAYKPRTLFRKFLNGAITESYYEREGKRIYQVLDKPSNVFTLANVYLDYPERSMNEGVSGTVFIACFIYQSGTAYFEVAKGINDEMNEAALSILKKKYMTFKIPRHNKENVIQEVILPMTFGESAVMGSPKFYSNWQFQNFQMQQIYNMNSMQHIQSIAPAPSFH